MYIYSMYAKTTNSYYSFDLSFQISVCISLKLVYLITNMSLNILEYMCLKKNSIIFLGNSLLNYYQNYNYNFIYRSFQKEKISCKVSQEMKNLMRVIVKHIIVMSLTLLLSSHLYDPQFAAFCYTLFATHVHFSALYIHHKTCSVCVWALYIIYSIYLYIVAVLTFITTRIK